MPAIKYVDIGGLAGEGSTRAVASTRRGRDRDALQSFVIECDPGDPVTATLHLQASVDVPPLTFSRTDPFPPLGADLLWSDITTIVLTAEAGTFFLQHEVEAAEHRFIIKAGNYTAGRILRIQTMV